MQNVFCYVTWHFCDCLGHTNCSLQVFFYRYFIDTECLCLTQVWFILSSLMSLGWLHHPRPTSMTEVDLQTLPTTTLLAPVYTMFLGPPTMPVVAQCSSLVHLLTASSGLSTKHTWFKLHLTSRLLDHTSAAETEISAVSNSLLAFSVYISRIF